MTVVKEVGNRKKLKGTSASRLVITSLSKDDVAEVDRICATYGHNARSGAMRFALRRLDDADNANGGFCVRLADRTAACIQVRKESRTGSEEYKQFRSAIATRAPVNLLPEDNNILESLRQRWELASFSQVIRLAIRCFKLTENY